MSEHKSADRDFPDYPDSPIDGVPAAVDGEQKPVIDEKSDIDGAPITDFILTEDVESSSFVASRDGVELGGVPFLEKDGRIVLLSTAVFPPFRGSGLGMELARRVLDTIRARNQRVTVMCPVFRKFFDQNPDYADLLDRKVPGL
jgi:predicted GNAT family acetyltransferase